MDFGLCSSSVWLEPVQCEMPRRSIEEFLSIGDVFFLIARFAGPQTARYVLQASKSLTLSPEWIDVAQHGELFIYCSHFSTNSEIVWKERYDSYNQVWKAMPDTPWAWREPHLAVLGEFIYAFGGSDREAASTDAVVRLHLHDGV